MKVLIIEDELPAAKRLCAILNEADKDIIVEGVKESVSSACKWINENNTPDLIFMDIQLSDGLSFEIFKQVEIKCPVIFTTAFDEYALQAFKVNSIDYLLKPIEINDLKSSLKKFDEMKKFFSSEGELKHYSQILKAITQGLPIYKSRFLIKSGQSFYRVGVEDCAYFHLENKLTYLVLFNGKKHLLDFSLDELEKQLDLKKYFRANRQYIINIEAITSVHNFFGGKLKLRLKPETDDNVIVSREKVTALKLWMGA